MDIEEFINWFGLLRYGRKERRSIPFQHATIPNHAAPRDARAHPRSTLVRLDVGSMTGNPSSCCVTRGSISPPCLAVLCITWRGPGIRLRCLLQPLYSMAMASQPLKVCLARLNTRLTTPSSLPVLVFVFLSLSHLPAPPPLLNKPATTVITTILYCSKFYYYCCFAFVVNPASNVFYNTRHKSDKIILYQLKILIWNYVVVYFHDFLNINFPFENFILF